MLYVVLDYTLFFIRTRDSIIFLRNLRTN